MAGSGYHERDAVHGRCRLRALLLEAKDREALVGLIDSGPIRKGKALDP